MLLVFWGLFVLFCFLSLDVCYYSFFCIYCCYYYCCFSLFSLYIRSRMFQFRLLLISHFLEKKKKKKKEREIFFCLFSKTNYFETLEFNYKHVQYGFQNSCLVTHYSKKRHHLHIVYETILLWHQLFYCSFFFQ